MKKTILKNLLVLSFAFGGLFLIGNNVFGQDVLEKETPPAITCSQHVSYGARCWKPQGGLVQPCRFTGYQYDYCV